VAWDSRAATGRLIESYREVLREKRGGMAVQEQASAPGVGQTVSRG
jgi:hypothetical protein